eukprot:CAMPEP_0194482340 /NCGR_PEP_ID=MMETSP0253-20130528/4340_1 /TAXON_ID=2966 /ORGANISM="Noctiluca scintillans" /LENGTH=126 /DNA_ID=CAMNT_0039321877 /DNA_START=30 /DNA_END=411 /DNA_ORIENTATION=+
MSTSTNPSPGIARADRVEQGGRSHIDEPNQQVAVQDPPISFGPPLPHERAILVEVGHLGTFLAFDVQTVSLQRPCEDTDHDHEGGKDMRTLPRDTLTPTNPYAKYSRHSTPDMTINQSTKPTGAAK